MSRQIHIAVCVEPNEFAFLDHVLEPGMTFLDAGGNDGISTVFAAKRVGGEGTVWAFEPSVRELGRLRHNLEINHPTARIFALALADCSGQMELSMAACEHTRARCAGGLWEKPDWISSGETDAREFALVMANPIPVALKPRHSSVEEPSWRAA